MNLYPVVPGSHYQSGVGARIAFTLRRDAEQAGKAALSYVLALKNEARDQQHDEWRVEMAYRLARSAASKAREWQGFIEGRITYPAGR